mgnify:CR=1 FL=1
MGLTTTGKNLGFFKGEMVSRENLYNNEKGKPLPKDKRCTFCHYVGERKAFVGRRQGKDQLEVYIFKGGRVIFFNNSDEVSLIGSEEMALPKVESGVVCLAGLKTCIDAMTLFILEQPDENRCFQHRICPPG